MNSNRASSSPLFEFPFSKNPRANNRHDARELALQILFQYDFHGNRNNRLDHFWSQNNASKSIQDFVNQLVLGVQSQQSELDQLIGKYSKNWRIDRMPVVDRNILRQAIYELLWIPDVPAKVTMDEALELAKCFADDEAKRFVNGILDQLVKHDSRLEEKRLAMT